MPVLPFGDIPPPSPVPRAKRPSTFAGTIAQSVLGGGSQGPAGPPGPPGTPGAAGAGTAAPIDVAANTTFTVATNTQVLFKQPITVEGSVVIQGTGMLIAL
jgi:hypothetical protein